ncbi:MAG: hypothetical protein M3Q89_11455 [Verrucomicrobiota bacterium]|nr:hypothetical protein [Verrucomicrobiota bacterium]
MKRRIILLALMTAALSLAGCTTVQTRIEEKPEAFRRMSSSDQALVTQGKVREGMSQDAVYIAWGPPNQRALGRNRGSTVETWIYFHTAAGSYYPSPFLYGPYAGFGYGLGYGGGFGYGSGYGGGFGSGRYRRGGYYRGFRYDPFYDPFFYNRTSVVSYPERTITFQSGRVIAYQFLPEPRFF